MFGVVTLFAPRSSSSKKGLHYRSRPKFLSMKGPSGRILPPFLCWTDRLVEDLLGLATTSSAFRIEPRLTGRVAAFFDVDNTVLPGEASEVRFFRWLWRRGVVGWPEVRASISWLIRHLPPLSLHPLRERKLYLAGKPSRVIRHLGTYGELYERHVGASTPVGIPREESLNALWTKGGLMYAMPFR